MKAWLLFPGLILLFAGCQFDEHSKFKSVGKQSKAPLKAPVQAGVIAISPENSKIEFTGATSLMSQTGHFDAFTGTLEMPTEIPKDASIRMLVDMDSTVMNIGLLTKISQS